MDSLPEWTMPILEELAVLVEDAPAPGSTSPGTTLLGLYRGIPVTAHGGRVAGSMPGTITLYRLPILGVCARREDVSAARVQGARPRGRPRDGDRGGRIARTRLVLGTVVVGVDPRARVSGPRSGPAGLASSLRAHIGEPATRGKEMTVNDASSAEVPVNGLPRGVRLATAATLGLVAPILSALVILGGVTAVRVSGATVIRALRRRAHRRVGRATGGVAMGHRGSDRVRLDLRSCDRLVGSIDRVAWTRHARRPCPVGAAFRDRRWIGHGRRDGLRARGSHPQLARMAHAHRDSTPNGARVPSRRKSPWEWPSRC